MRGAMQAWLTAITRCHSVFSGRRAVSASGESWRISRGQPTLGFRDLLTAQVAQHRLCFRPGKVLRRSIGSRVPRRFSPVPSTPTPDTRQ